MSRRARADLGGVVQPVIDLHQDVLPHLRSPKAFLDTRQTSWEQLAASPIRVVVSSCWPGLVAEPGSREATEQTEAFLRCHLRLPGGWRRVLAAEDLDACLLAGATTRGAIAHAEGIDADVEDDVEGLLERWFELGCRSVGLMWNVENGLGHPSDEPELGLTDKGRRAVRWLDAHPVVLDVAHMGERTFWDTLGESENVVIASHANARSLCDHPRNLNDAQARAIGERGGVVGVAAVPEFVGGASPNLARLADHAEHFAATIGIDHVAIGSDLGGLTDGCLKSLETPEDMLALMAELRRRGWTDEQISAISHRSARRVLHASLAK